MKFTVAVAMLIVLTATAKPQAAEKPAPGKQVEQEFTHADGKGKTGYLLFLPEGYKADGEKKWPVIFFLHGRGESYGPLSLVKKWGPPRLVEKNPEFPFVVVSPQCPGKDSWNRPTQQKILADLLADVVKKHNVDERRIYLTGLSMGGYGSWTLAAGHPKKFAAVAPICGGGNPDDAAKLKDIPIWVFHGDKDRAVPLKRSVEMVNAIKKAGGSHLRFTTLEHIGHNSWSAAYATPELYAWMLRHVLPVPKTK